MKDAMYLVRMYEPEADYGMIEEWARGHGKNPPPAPILPRLGIVVREIGAKKSTDVAALWLYMDNSVGVCFAEHVITMPGLSLKRAKAALLRAIDCLRKLASEMNYAVMMVHTLPGIARFLRNAGFRSAGEGRVTMAALTNESYGN